MAVEFSVSADDIDEIAAWTVIRAARELARKLGHELAPLDLSPVEFGVLAQLAAADGLGQAELARSVGVRPQSMTALVTGLERRARSSTAARIEAAGASRIRLTGEGRALLELAYPKVVASNAWFGDDVTATDALRSTLRPMLTTTSEPAPDVP